MKREKSVASREFQHRFGRVASRLKPGERVAVTKHGQTLGFFTKAQKAGQAPDYMANLEKLGHSAAAGQKLIDRIQ